MLLKLLLFLALCLGTTTMSPIKYKMEPQRQDCSHILFNQQIPMDCDIVDKSFPKESIMMNCTIRSYSGCQITSYSSGVTVHNNRSLTSLFVVLGWSYKKTRFVDHPINTTQDSLDQPGHHEALSPHDDEVALGQPGLMSSTVQPVIYGPLPSTDYSPLEIAMPLGHAGPFFQINLETSMVTDDNFEKEEEVSVVDSRSAVGGKSVREKKKMSNPY